MTKIEPRHNCSLTNLFHFRVDPEDSIVKKVFKAIGYLLFHITTLGIPLLVHHLIVHNCCNPGDGFNTISSTVTPDATITSAVKKTEIEDKKDPPVPQDGKAPPIQPPKSDPKPAVQPVSKDPVETPPKSDPTKPPVETPVDKPVPEPVLPHAPMPPPSGPAATTALLNLMCQDFINGRAPLNSYPTVRNTMGGTDINPHFSVTYPMTFQTFSRQMGLDSKLATSLGDTAEQIQLKTAALDQLTYLQDNYYVINVSGDGNCFYRAYMTGWILHLTQTYCNDPHCFEAAADLVLSKVDFMESSQENRDLAKNTAKLLRDMGRIERVSVKKVMDNVILKQPMESVFVPFARALSQFESKAMAFQQLDEANLRAMAMVHLNEDPSHITGALRTACRSEAPRRKGFVGAMGPIPSSETHSMSAPEQMLFAASHLPLTVRHPELVSFIQSIPLDFIDAETLLQQAIQIQKAVCNGKIPLFQKAWAEHCDAIKNGPPLPFFIEVYSFLKNYCDSIKVFQNANSGDITAFLNLVENAIRATIQPRHADSHPEASAILHNMLMTKTFWNAVLKRPESGSGTLSSIELTKTICSKLQTFPGLSNHYRHLYQQSLLTLSPALQEDFRNFAAPGSSANYLKKILSQETLLGLFLNSRSSTNGLTNLQKTFKTLWSFEMSRFIMLTPLEELGKDAALSLSSLLYLDLPSSTDLLPPGVQPGSPNYTDPRVKLSALSKVLEFLANSPEAVICHPVFSIILEAVSQVTLEGMESSKVQELKKKALHQINILFGNEFAIFQNYLARIFPPSLVIGEALMIHLFLSTSPERKAIVENNPDLAPFATNFLDNLKTALKTKLTENPDLISNVRFQRFLTFSDRFGQSSRCLTGQISLHPLPNRLLIQRILGSLSGRTLYEILSSISTQAEGSNVEAMSHSFIRPAICESFFSGNIAYSSGDIARLTATHNFMEGGGMAPEHSAQIHLFRITNHYCCLVPKYKDNNATASSSR